MKLWFVFLIGCIVGVILAIGCIFYGAYLAGAFSPTPLQFIMPNGSIL